MKVIGLDYKVTDEKINTKITYFGVFFLSFRFLCMRPFQFDHYSWDSEILHTSFLVIFLASLSLVASFRIKFLNMAPLAILPSIVFTIPFHDFPRLLHPENYGHQYFDLYWFNSLTIHIPLLFMSLFMIYTRKETLSRQSFWIILPLYVWWFLALDNKENGVVNGNTYIFIALGVLFLWGPIVIFGILKDVKTDDPLIAPVLKIKGFAMVESKYNWVKKLGNSKI